VFEWFREKEYYVSIIPFDVGYSYVIYSDIFKEEETDNDFESYYDSYEKAESAAINCIINILKP
jgi:hypothetical protein